jgi:hypothetical protein
MRSTNTAHKGSDILSGLHAVAWGFPADDNFSRLSTGRWRVGRKSII